MKLEQAVKKIIDKVNASGEGVVFFVEIAEKVKKRKDGIIAALAKWEYISGLKEEDISLDRVLREYQSDSCGLCTLYLDNMCDLCPLDDNNETDTGCCIQYDKYAENPCRRTARLVRNKIRREYKKLYGEDK